METKPVVVVGQPIVPSSIIASMTEHFKMGTPGVALDLSAHTFEDPNVEEFLLELEANFALEQKQITLIVGTPGTKRLKEQRAQMAKLIRSCPVVTAVMIEGAREGVESLKRFLKDELYVTMPVYAEIT
jgi:hypothetical protein